MTDTTPPTPRAPVRWRVGTWARVGWPGTTDIVTVGTLPEREWIGWVSKEAADRIVAEHNALLDVLDLAERGAPAFQIAEFIRDVLGIPTEAP